MKKITIITGAYGCLPPYALGAIEKLWFQIGEEWKKMGYEVCYVCKKPEGEILSSDNNVYIKGYERSNSILKDTFQYELIYSLKAMIKAPKSDITVLSIIWGPLLIPFFRKKLGLSLFNVARFPKWFYKYFNKVDKLSCVSTAVYDALLKISPNLRDKSCVVPNPIDVSIYNAKGSHIYSSTPKIIFMGRVHKEKGLHTLVKAIDEVRKEHDVTLEIIGPTSIGKGGSGMEYVQELNSLTSGWNINWVNPIYNPKELAERMRKAHIFCYPSEAEMGETFGVAPLEAMGLGLVPIVSSLGCFSDFIRNGENGLVYDHRANNASEQLAQCIKKLIDNEYLYKKYSEAAIKISSLFSIQNIAEQYIKELEKKH